MQITSTTIVQLCSKLAALSANQAGLGTADFLNFANLVQTSLVSELLMAREEYLIRNDSIPVVSGTSAYRVPYRAINGTIRHLWFESADGITRQRLWTQNIEDMENYSTTTTGSPTGFYIEGNYIHLLPTPNVTGNLVVAYPFRPNQLVDASTCQTISTVSTNSVTVPNIPSNFVSGGLYDIIDHQSGNGVLYYDLQGFVSGNLITFTPNLPLAQVGNYIAVAGQSPVPMLPEEGHPLLLESTIMRIEMIRGNAARIKNSATIIQDTRKAWDSLLNNRVQSKAHPAGNGGAQFPLRPW